VLYLNTSFETRRKKEGVSGGERALQKVFLFFSTPTLRGGEEKRIASSRPRFVRVHGRRRRGGR